MMTPTARDPDRPLVLTAQPNFSDDDCACDEVILKPRQPEASDNDCACACGEAQSSPRVAPWESALFQKSHELYHTALPGGFTLALSPVSPNGPAVLNAAAWEVLRQFETPRPLRSDPERELAECGLLRPLEPALPDVAQEGPRQLTAWLHITNACNLDCPYCYVRKSSAHMSAETGRRAIAAVFRSAQQHGMGQVKLKYAGGEAALHFELVRALHDQAQQLARDHGQQLQAVLLSNGTALGASESAWLLASGVRLMISLDGVGDSHDRLRSQAEGGGTFAAIERCMDEILLPQGMRPTISITLTGGNCAGAADAARWALVRGLPVSLNFYRSTDANAGQAGLEWTEAQIIAGMRAVYGVFEEMLPEQPFFNGLLDRFRIGAHARPCGAGQGYVVLTHAGQLAECHMRLDAPLPGALEDDLLAAIQGGHIRNLAVDEKSGCAGCLYRYYCAGGCPLETFRARRRWDAPGPNCRIYRELAPAALRLEGLRLLKRHGFL